MCAVYTKIETCHNAHEVYRIHACTMQHTQCIHTAYISATFMHILGTYTAYILHICLLPSCTYIRHTAYILHIYLLHAHILGMYTAYILHTCTPAHVIHVCCTHAAHKNWLSATRMPYKHMKKCMQFVCNCLHAACTLHITIAHMVHTCIQMCATSCTWHACVMYVACVWR